MECKDLFSSKGGLLLFSVLWVIQVSISAEQEKMSSSVKDWSSWVRLRRSLASVQVIWFMLMGVV
jgi:hypothetical protein